MYPGDRQGNSGNSAAVFAATGALAPVGLRERYQSSEETTGLTRHTAAAGERFAVIEAIAIHRTRRPSKVRQKLIVEKSTSQYARQQVQKIPAAKIVGFDVDLMNASRPRTLGLPRSTASRDFAARSSLSIQGGEFPTPVCRRSTDTKEREESVDFVTRTSKARSILWAQKPRTPESIPTARGKKVSGAGHTTEENRGTACQEQVHCIDAGKPAIEIISFDGQDAATNAVVLGQARRDVGGLAGDRLAPSKQSNGKLEAAGRDRRCGTVRVAHAEGPTAGADRSAGARASDRERPVQADRNELGRREGRSSTSR